MKSRIISLLLLSATSISYNALAEYRGYFGVSGGLSLPLKNKFSIKDDGQTFDTKVKKSNMATVALGYNLGDGVAIEFGVDFKPKYPMKVMLPNNLSLDTKAVANIYMLSVVYDFAKVGELTPYFVAGIGLGDIRIKGGSVNSGDLKVFELNKAHRTALAFQLGIGDRISRQISFDDQCR